MIKGDKIKLVKPMGAFTNVGEICEVVNVQNGGVISFKFGGGKHLGCMSYDEFERYFELVSVENKVEKKKHEWTEWKDVSLLPGFYNPITDKYVNVILEWRTDNKKRVQVRMKDDPQLRSRASCYKDDKFSVYNGYDLARRRVYVKWLSKLVDEYAKSL